MREHLDRGLEPIGDVARRVITQVAIIYQQPALSCSRQERNHFRRMRKWMPCGRIGERPTMNRNLNGYFPESFQ